MNFNDPTVQAIIGTAFAFLTAALGYFIIDRFRKADADNDKLTKISETVSEMKARQEGQISFAKTVLDHHERLGRIEEKVDALHLRLDRHVGNFDKFMEKLHIL